MALIESDDNNILYYETQGGSIINFIKDGETVPSDGVNFIWHEELDPFNDATITIDSISIGEYIKDETDITINCTISNIGNDTCSVYYRIDNENWFSYDNISEDTELSLNLFSISDGEHVVQLKAICSHGLETDIVSEDVVIVDPFINAEISITEVYDYNIEDKYVYLDCNIANIDDFTSDHTIHIYYKVNNNEWIEYYDQVYPGTNCICIENLPYENNTIYLKAICEHNIETNIASTTVDFRITGKFTENGTYIDVYNENTANVYYNIETNYYNGWLVKIETNNGTIEYSDESESLQDYFYITSLPVGTTNVKLTAIHELGLSLTWYDTITISEYSSGSGEYSSGSGEYSSGSGV